MRRKITRRIKELQRYDSSLEGMIIYVDSTDRWCNVNIVNEVTFFRIPFGEGVHPRLRRVGQYVTLTPTPGNRTKYLITGAARRILTDTAFASKGTADYDDIAYWNEGYVWG